MVVASVHSFFDLSAEAQTERVIRAMRNPHVNIIGHPTGRLIGSRAPYAIDMDRVTSAARDLGCFLEINAQPERLDLNDIHAHMAKSKGVKLAVSTDSHATSSFDYIRFGIDQARRAWLTAKRRHQHALARGPAQALEAVRGVSGIPMLLVSREKLTFINHGA